MRVELVYMQYNLSDGQALFWCFALIILSMVSLYTLFLCSVWQQAWFCFQLVLKNFCQNQGFCSYIKKSVWYHKRSEIKLHLLQMQSYIVLCMKLAWKILFCSSVIFFFCFLLWLSSVTIPDQFLYQIFYTAFFSRSSMSRFLRKYLYFLGFFHCLFFKLK